MSLRSILDANNKIPLSCLEANGGATPGLSEVLTVDNDCNAEFIDDCGGLVLTNGASPPSKIQLISNIAPGGGPTSSCLYANDSSGNLSYVACDRLFVGDSSNNIPLVDLYTDTIPTGTPGTTCLYVNDSTSTLSNFSCSSLFLGGVANDIKLSTQTSTDPAGNASEILQVQDYSGGTATIDVSGLFVGNIEIQNADGRIYFENAADETTLTGAIVGRLPVIFNGVTFYLPLYSS